MTGVCDPEMTGPTTTHFAYTVLSICTYMYIYSTQPLSDKSEGPIGKSNTAKSRTPQIRKHTLDRLKGVFVGLFQRHFPEVQNETCS